MFLSGIGNFFSNCRSNLAERVRIVNDMNQQMLQQQLSINEQNRIIEQVNQQNIINTQLNQMATNNMATMNMGMPM